MEGILKKIRLFCNEIENKKLLKNNFGIFEYSGKSRQYAPFDFKLSLTKISLVTNAQQQ